MPISSHDSATANVLLPPFQEVEQVSPHAETPPVLRPLSLWQLLNLSVGIIGIQFAWSMQIALSSKILEPLGADPFLYGLIWCAGPITGILVQPLVGALSDQIWTPLGRRRPFILGGALLGSVALLLFPFSRFLWMAALLIWVIDACVNMAQGPYRALIPDIAPPEQTTVANSYMNTAFGVGSCIALGVAPILKFVFHIEMSLQQQYIMAALALLLLITYSSILIKEYRRPAALSETPDSKENSSLKQAFSTFLRSSPEIHKVCMVQFFTWVGMMCMFIYLTPYVAHTVYKLPDRSDNAYKNLETLGKQLEEASKPLIAEQLKPQTLTVLWQALHKATDETVNNTEKESALNVLAQALPMAQTKLETSFSKALTDYKQVHPHSMLKPSAKDAAALSQQAPFSFIENAALKKDLLLLQTQPMQELLEKEPVTSGTTAASENKINWALAWQTVADIPAQLPYAFSKKIEKKSYLALDSAEGKESSLLVWAYVLAQKSTLTTTLNELETLNPTLRQTVYQALLNHRLGKLDEEATNTAQKALVALNLVPLLLSIPMGLLASRLGKKPVYTFTLACMALAFGLMPLATTPLHLLLLMGLAGVAWATILSIPFAFLCDYMKPGQEGSIMGIFNMFIAAPQLISATVVGWLITLYPVQTLFGSTHQWPLAFQIASGSLVLAIIALQWVKEAPRSEGTTPSVQVVAAAH